MNESYYENVRIPESLISYFQNPNYVSTQVTILEAQQPADESIESESIVEERDSSNYLLNIPDKELFRI